VQVAEASPDDSSSADPAAISRKVGPARRLSDGGAQLFGNAVVAGQDQRPRPQGAAGTQGPSCRYDIVVASVRFRLTWKGGFGPLSCVLCLVSCVLCVHAGNPG